MKAILIVCLILIIVPPAAACLGWTEAQCRGKYGSEVDRPVKKTMDGRTLAPDKPKPNALYRRSFVKNEMRVTAEFINDRCVRICYDKPRRMNTEEWKKLREIILAANLGSAAAWNPDEKIAGKWWRSDGSAMATAQREPTDALSISHVSQVPEAEGGAKKDTSPKAADFKF